MIAGRTYLFNVVMPEFSVRRLAMKITENWTASRRIEANTDVGPYVPDPRKFAMRSADKFSRMATIGRSSALALLAREVDALAGEDQIGVGNFARVRLVNRQIPIGAAVVAFGDRRQRVAGFHLVPAW